MTLAQETFQDNCNFLFSKSDTLYSKLDLNQLIAIYNVASNIAIAESIQSLIKKIPQKE